MRSFDFEEANQIQEAPHRNPRLMMAFIKLLDTLNSEERALLKIFINEFETEIHLIFHKP